MDDEDEYDDREREFHNTVREYIIFLLLFLVLFIVSCTIIDYFRGQDNEDYLSTDLDEATVYKVSLYLCVFALSVTICAALLHPFSIVSNEVLLKYPRSYYVKWLNHSLIQGIWNIVFLFSNLSLFGLLPFAYLFTESEGLSGHRRGVKSRVYETCTVLFLLTLLIFGLSYVISAFIYKDRTNYVFFSFGYSYLPFLYSCISFLGVVLLLLCTPLGFIRLFGIVSRFLVKPQFLHNVNDEYFATLMEIDLIERRLKQVSESGKTYLQPEPMFPPLLDTEDEREYQVMILQNGALQMGLHERLGAKKLKKELLEKQKSSSSIQRNFVYPLAMLALLALTVVTIFLVLVNSLQLLIGVKALPKSTAFTLGLSSLSKLGTPGACIEVAVILYLVVASYVGLYTVPFLAKAKVRPRPHRTPLSLLIANCALLLVLSSALPLLSRILGITDFDLLGHFGNIEWLGNFKIVFTYNLLFAGVTSCCLINQLTAPVCKDLFLRCKVLLSSIKNGKIRFRPSSIFSASSAQQILKED